MNEYKVKYSKVWREGSRISCEQFGATITAEDEDEVRSIMEEEEPGYNIDSITLIGEAE